MITATTSLRPSIAFKRSMLSSAAGVAVAGYLVRDSLWSVVLIVLAISVSAFVTLRYRRHKIRTQFALNATAQKAQDVLDSRFVLYLRPFVTSGRLPVRTYLPSLDRLVLGHEWDIELAFSLALEGLVPLVAIGHDESAFGSAKLQPDDASWFDLMVRLAERAAAIVIVPLNRPSTMREVQHLFEHPALLGKTVFVMPPERTGWRRWLRWYPVLRWWRDAAAELERIGITVPEHARKGGLFTVVRDGKVGKWLDWRAFERQTLGDVVRAVEQSPSRLDEIRLPGAFRLMVQDALFRYFVRVPSYITVVASMFTAVIGVVVALVIRTFVAQAFTVPSGSMMDTLLVGDYILVNKFIYGPELPFTETRLPGLRLPQRGDIVVFKFPRDERLDMVKRIVAMPGETVQVRGNQVLIDGGPIDEPYVRQNSYAPGYQSSATFCRYAYGCDPTRVPPDSYFIMGDNRDNSQDSRYWGFVRREKIKGKVFLVYWSWDADRHWRRWQRIGKYIP